MRSHFRRVLMDEAKVTSALAVYSKCVEGRARAEANVQESLAQLRGAAETSTFELNGQWYQIRERKGKLYLCELDGKPKGRPKKTPEQRERDRLEREQQKANASEAADCPDHRREGPPEASAEAGSTGGEGEAEPSPGAGADGGDNDPRTHAGEDSAAVQADPGGDMGEPGEPSTIPSLGETTTE